jgi:enoyl-CoA hydratase
MSATVDNRGDAVVVTLRWTNKRNALSYTDTRELADALREAGQGDASALVLTGEGAFCSGGDLRAFAELSRTKEPDWIRERVYGDVQELLRALRQCPIPTIAAIDGASIGLGMDLALACDMRFLGPEGWLLQGWGRAGLVAGTGGVEFLQHLRPGLIWRLIADQPKMDAAAASAAGLAEVGEPNALEAALARANALSVLGRDLLADYVRLARPISWPSDSHMELCAELQGKRIGSAAFRALADRLLK